jgi:hypothetical protein
MALILNGNGSIQDLVAGGLPDATVTQAELATGVGGTGPAFSAYLGTAQIITTDVFTKLAINTEVFDTANAFNTGNYRFTPQVTGYYQINAIVYGSATVSMIALYSALYKNGSLYQYGGIQNLTVGSSGQAMTLNTLVYMNGTTDYVELYGLISGSGTCTYLSAGSSVNYFNGVLVRAA